MRILTLIILPLFLWSQQSEVRLYWDGTQQLHLGELLKEVPSATDQIVFYDDESKRFSITITKPINANSNTIYSIQNIQTQAFEKELDLDLSQFSESPDVLIYKTKGVEISTPFIKTKLLKSHLTTLSIIGFDK